MAEQKQMEMLSALMGEEGQERPVLQKWVKRTPFFARLSRLGVRISPP